MNIKIFGEKTGNGLEVDSNKNLLASSIIRDENGRYGKMDNSTGAFETIDYAHHEIHSGDHYFATGYQDLPINKVLDFTFETSDTTKWKHFIWKIQTESEFLWAIYESPRVITELIDRYTPLNSNRNFSDDSSATVRWETFGSLSAANSSTDVDRGTLLKAGILGSGKEGGDASRENEVVLKQNTIYTTMFENGSSGNNKITLNCKKHNYTFSTNLYNHFKS